MATAQVSIPDSGLCMAIVWPADIRFGGQLGWPGGGLAEMPMPLRPYQAGVHAGGQSGGARRWCRVFNPDRNRAGNRGNWSNRSEPVPAGFKPVQIQNSNLNFKNEKFSKKFLKILQVATNLMVSIFFKYSFI